MVLKKIAGVFGGDPHKKEIEKLSLIVDEINTHEAAYESLSDEALRAKTDEFKQRLADGETLDDILPEAFAVVREAGKRTIGLRHYDIQMIGGMTLHKGRIAEMRTGEGKTLVATLPVYLNALTGKGVHLVTVNDYLARRDARWMTPIYQLLGLTVGVLQMANRTENGKMAFLVDLDKTNAREDLHQLSLVTRAEAYKADIVYGTNSEFGFDYLRDNLTMTLAERVQRGHYFAIVDEVDNILIDEARTPLIISGPASDDTEGYVKMSQVVKVLNPEDYEINEKDRQVSLTEIGEAHVEEVLGQTLRDPDRPEDITPEQARWLGFLEQGLRAQHLFRKNKDYIVQGGKVVIVDEFTGRLMPGRRWSEGLHQAVEAKEGVKIEPENVTYATITIQNYFRMYEKLSGMTGTALTEAEEFGKIYKLDVLPIPMNLEYMALKKDSDLILIDTKDENKYSIQYYARKSDVEKKPIYWRRQDFPDTVYRTQEGKLRAIVKEVLRFYIIGRPQLVGTTSVEYSELLSRRLNKENIRKLVQILIIRDAWIEKNNNSPEIEIKELQPLNRPLDNIDNGELDNLAKQAGLKNIKIEDTSNLHRLIKIFDLDEKYLDTITQAIQEIRIPHKILNAKEHAKESEIIANAGVFKAITIATNMAGRGVDIKLGGQIHEDIIASIRKILDKKIDQNAYNLSIYELLKYYILDLLQNEVLNNINNSSYDFLLNNFSSENFRMIRMKLLMNYETPYLSNEWEILGNFISNTFGYGGKSIQNKVIPFWRHVEESLKVSELGGLHVIGSERHEARRIDNQLRGRAARQGDPGSSRFYLSLEDELMRLFGGVQMEAMMSRLKVDPNLPIESGILGRMVEQAQERVEGNNFDLRKHLLEYDDVLNTQRKRIYGERNRTFEKTDLHDDVIDLLRTELQDRIPKALKDEEGPWKLLAYLDEVQPSMAFEQEKVKVPSFTLNLLKNEVLKRLHDLKDEYKVKDELLKIADETLNAEKEHILKTAQTFLDKIEITFDQDISERLETLDNYFDGLSSDAAEGESAPQRRPQELLEEVSNLTHTPLRLPTELLRQLPSGDDEVKKVLSNQIINSLKQLSINRVLSIIERRVDESLEMKPNQLMELEWFEISTGIMEALISLLERRNESLLSDQGQISRSIDVVLSNNQPNDNDHFLIINLLYMMSVGIKVNFNPSTKKQTATNINILSYPFLGARFIQDIPTTEIINEILDHLEETRGRLEIAWGRMEFDRFRLAGVPLAQLDQKIKNSLSEALGEVEFATIESKLPDDLTDEQKEVLTVTLGTRIQNDIYRHILVSVISELWVEYLTRVDALRVSIGMEAFAQRDPLVQYKSQAAEMFKNLLSDIRAGVISRMFRFQPRRAGAAVERTTPQISINAPAAAAQSSDKKKKRKRH